MANHRQGDLVINGVGTSNGGAFEQVYISGKGTVHSSVDCSYFKCSGTGTVNGDIKSVKTKVSGLAKVNGNILSENVTIEGRASISGNAKVDKLMITGKCSISGHVKGENIHVKGSMVVDGDCEAETFKAEGRLSVGGLLTAEKINIVTGGNCKAKEIGGGTIIVRKKTNIIRELINSIYPIRLETDLIEGDQIELENTKAKTVRGSHIIIGENCEIDFVEYKDSIRIDKNGLVKEKVQI